MTTQLQSAQPPAPTGAPAAEPAIQVTGLTKIYGPRGGSVVPVGLVRAARVESEKKPKAAADDVTFSVAPGEFFVIMGLSGSGKSTVLRMLNRLVEPTSGELLIDGRDVATMPDADLRELRNRKINMVFQHFALFPHRTVRENAAYALHVRHESEATRTERADWALETVGLGDWGDSLPGRAVGRDAAAGGAGPRAGLRRGHPADGRAVQRAGPAHPPRHAGPADDPAARPAAHGRVRHPRPQRGHAHGRPNHDHAQRQGGAARHGTGDPQHPGRRLRHRSSSPTWTAHGSSPPPRSCSSRWSPPPSGTTPRTCCAG